MADEVFSPAGQSPWWPMPGEIRVAWSSTLIYGAQLFQQWSGPALVIYLESGGLHASGSLDNCLGTPDGKWGLSPGSYLWVVPF